MFEGMFKETREELETFKQEYDELENQVYILEQDISRESEQSTRVKYENEQYRQLLNEQISTEVSGGTCLICYQIQPTGVSCDICRRFVCDQCIVQVRPVGTCSFCRTENAQTHIVRFS